MSADVKGSSGLNVLMSVSFKIPLSDAFMSSGVIPIFVPAELSRSVIHPILCHRMVFVGQLFPSVVRLPTASAFSDFLKQWPIVLQSSYRKTRRNLKTFRVPRDCTQKVSMLCHPPND